MPTDNEIQSFETYAGGSSPPAVIACTRADIEPLVLAHYLHKWPAVVTKCFALKRDEAVIGALVFAIPPRETLKRYSVRSAWELARLYLTENNKNEASFFIAAAIKAIRRAHPEVEVLVSYADPERGHEGTIYKAANWIDDGLSADRTDRVVNGERKTRGAHPTGQLVQRGRKHRFIYWIRDHEKYRQAVGRAPRKETKQRGSLAVESGSWIGYWRVKLDGKWRKVCRKIGPTTMPREEAAADLQRRIHDSIPQSRPILPGKVPGRPAIPKRDGRRGSCYHTSEALWHLLGGASSPWKPQVLRIGEETHWWLRHENGTILDPTAKQFAAPPDYGKGRNAAFFPTKAGISQRAKALAESLLWQEAAQ